MKSWFFRFVYRIEQTAGECILGELPEHDAAEAFLQGVERFLADGGGIVEGREELLFGAVHIGCVCYRVPMVDKTAIGRKIGGEILVADPSEKMTRAVQAIIDAVDVPEDPGVEGHTDGYFAHGDTDGIEPANGMIDGFHIL